jgi:hypothetical protein
MPNSDDSRGGGAVVAFPFSRLRPKGPLGPARDLGLGKMAQTLGLPREQMSGHWCSRCKGIWFGYLLEVECPVCGNRNG